ncbi:MAG: hypothetical protein ABEK12_01470, partial [Candidatus Nanohaloarchaea archaeon]
MADDAEDDVLTLAELREVQGKERDSDTLQPLDEEFFDRAREYLDTKRGSGDVLDNREYRNARNILEDIMDRRQKKIMKLAFLSMKSSSVQVDNLMDTEAEMFDDIAEVIGTYRRDLDELVFEDATT